MQWLGAALAFAITMLALSTIVTTTVETIHRIVGLREKGLRLMLGHFYDAVIAPHVDPGLAATANARDRFLDLMTANRAPIGEATLPIGAGGDAANPRDDANDRSFLNWIWGGRRLGSLSVEDFMARLGDSGFGDAIAKVQASGTNAFEVVLHDMAHKFESFGRDASEYFQARARLVSVLVAFVIGWQCYVNPLLLARTFLRDPDVTAKVIEAGPKFIQMSKDAEASLEARIKEEQRNDAAAASNQSPEKKEGASPAAPKGPSEDEKSLAFVKDGKRQAAEIIALGAPIGWTDARLKEAGFEYAWFGLVYPRRLPEALPTTAWLLLGGLLIGLGAPFWRDAVLSLTAFRDRAQAAAAQAQAIGQDPIALAAKRFLTASEARATIRIAATDNETDVPVG